MADPPGGGASKAASRGTGIFNGSVYNSQRAAHQRFAGNAFHAGRRDRRQSFSRFSNDLVAGHRAGARSEFRSYYILGYYTTNSDAGRQVSQDHGQAEQRTSPPSWNSATATSATRSGANSTAPIRNSSCSRPSLRADPQTDLPLALEVDYFRISPTAYFVPVSVKIPGSVIALAEKGAGGETQFDFVGQVIDERKHIVANVRDFIKVKLDASEAEKLATRNFHYDAGFTLAPGRYRIQFLVRENQYRQDGHVRRPLRRARSGRRFHAAQDQLRDLEQSARADQSRRRRRRKTAAQQRNRRPADCRRREDRPQHHQGLPPQPEHVHHLRRLRRRARPRQSRARAASTSA